MIRSLKVEGLNNQVNADLEFNEDLNLITGRNGAGKTTLLKLIWYLISGNLDRIIPEIPFKSVSIETDQFFLSIDVSPNNITICWKFDDEKNITRRNINEWVENEWVELRRATFRDLSEQIARKMQSSLFFPTFRRIEGGLSRNLISSVADDSTRYRSDSITDTLQRAMSQISTELSVLNHDNKFNNHSFISSISTHDIVELLTQAFADVSERTDSLQVKLSKEITQKIKDYYQASDESETQKLEDATSVLDDIEKSVNQVAEHRDLFFRPFSVLSELIGKIFRGRGIRVTEVITLGDTEEALSSDKLSAGEKQMLSFLCYNAFSDNTIIFIDEPELSLHVDWQRSLLPTLLDQGTGNQFFIATHSPFIYARYPDKEILLGDDRGGEI